ncbi:MAG: DUF1524 domain-containing protein [Endozoicomonadaceae bacterium]|nr:DUF1524 domain-containing protein [Endozoicomonadaceae bacterium]
MKISGLIFLMILSNSELVHSHPGTLNQSGCHIDQSSKNFHCHRNTITVDDNTYLPFKHSLYMPYGWLDRDYDCKNTEHELLDHDSRVKVIFESEKQCKVIEGEWQDPFTLNVTTNINEMTAEHIVPLSHAHSAGGHSWPLVKRARFSSDSVNLILLSKTTAQNRGGSPPHKWMPPNLKAHCFYLRRWRHIKYKYKLKADNAEKSFIDFKLKSC